MAKAKTINLLLNDGTLKGVIDSGSLVDKRSKCDFSSYVQHRLTY